MIDLLIRDANNYDRSDTRFPYLRDFDIYAGHDWASGHGSFASGNNQESSSEGMNFAGALIQWGQATGNTAVRDAGIYIYTTQAAAIADYWFDVDGDVFPASSGTSTVGMVWGDGGAYATWFSADPEKIQGINQLPITGSHLYLGLHPAYNKINYDEVVRNRGGEPIAWQDILWEFLALGDPDLALSKFRANPASSPRRESRKPTPSTGSVTSLRWATSTRGSPPTTRWRQFHQGRPTQLRGGQHLLGAADRGILQRHPGHGAGRQDRRVRRAHLERRERRRSSGNGPDTHTDADPHHRRPPRRPPPLRRLPPQPTPTQTPTPTPTPTTTPTAPTQPGRYFLRADGRLRTTAPATGTVTLAAANCQCDGTPEKATTFVATGINQRPGPAGRRRSISRSTPEPRSAAPPRCGSPTT